MNAHRIEAVLAEDKRLTLEDLPFRAGDAVEVIVLAAEAMDGHSNGGVATGAPVECDADDDPVWRLAAEAERVWREHGAPQGAPPNWAANFKAEKQRRILNQNHE